MGLQPVTHTRFAAFDGGRLVALVADGLPAWPDDLSGTTAEELASMESAYLAEFHRLAADPASDITAVRTFSAHVLAVRAELAARAVAAEHTEEPPAPEGTETAPEGAVELSADERAAELAALTEGLAPAPVEPGPGETITASTSISRDDLVAIVTAATEASQRAMAPTLTALSEALTASARPVGGVQVTSEPPTARSLGAYRPAHRAPLDADARANLGRLNPKLVSVIDHHRDNTDLQPGSRIDSIETLGKAMAARWENLGFATGTSDEKDVVARVSVDESKVDKNRDLRGLPMAEARRLIQKVTGPEAVGVNPFTGKEALVASGGLPYPLEPYYPQLVVSEGDRPVQEAHPTFLAERGGIITVLPPSLASISAIQRPGYFADGTTATNTSLVSATAAFSAADVGKPVVDAGLGFIPTGTIINTVTNATTVVLSQATTGSATTSVPFYLPARNPNNLGAPVGIVTAAQDAIGPPTTIKYTYDVQAGGQVSYPVYAVYTSLQFANLTARVNPESVEANIRLADALTARVADSQMLDVLTTRATLMTAAKTFGTARQFLSQAGHVATFLRNLHRMNPAAIIMMGIPAWAVNNMRQDYFSTFLGVGAPDWALSDAEIDAWFADRNIMPWYYWDGPTDISMLFPTSGVVAATNTGTNSATPMTLPDYPGTGATTSFRTHIVAYYWVPGAVIGETTGELNLGLVRDSITNAQNRFRNFEELWESPAFVGPAGSLVRCDHTVAADGTYGAAATITLGAGSGL